MSCTFLFYGEKKTLNKPKTYQEFLKLICPLFSLDPNANKFFYEAHLIKEDNSNKNEELNSEMKEYLLINEENYNVFLNNPQYKEVSILCSVEETKDFEVKLSDGVNKEDNNFNLLAENIASNNDINNLVNDNEENDTNAVDNNDNNKENGNDKLNGSGPSSSAQMNNEFNQHNPSEPKESIPTSSEILCPLNAEKPDKISIQNSEEITDINKPFSCPKSSSEEKMQENSSEPQEKPLENSPEKTGGSLPKQGENLTENKEFLHNLVMNSIKTRIKLHRKKVKEEEKQSQLKLKKEQKEKERREKKEKKELKKIDKEFKKGNFRLEKGTEEALDIKESNIMNNDDDLEKTESNIGDLLDIFNNRKQEKISCQSKDNVQSNNIQPTSQFSEENELQSHLNLIITQQLSELKDEILSETSEQFKEVISKSNLKLKGNNEGKSVHNVKCDGCGCMPIYGSRYKCVYCDAFNYCEMCMEGNNRRHEHPFYKLKYNIAGDS